MYDDEPTQEQPATAGPPGTGEPVTGHPATEVPSGPPAARPRRFRAHAASGALASRTAGWMIAAALGGSLVTLLATGQLTSSRLTYVQPSAAQQPLAANRQWSAGPKRPAVAPIHVQAVPAPVRVIGPACGICPSQLRRRWFVIAPGPMAPGAKAQQVPLPRRAIIWTAPGRRTIVRRAPWMVHRVCGIARPVRKR